MRTRLIFTLLALASALRGAAPYLLDQAELSALAKEAPAAMRAPIRTVVEKPQPSPSGDPHDYVSYARYYWPDPTKPDGRPFVSRDGHHNLEQVARGDHGRLWEFAKQVEILAAAWAVRGDEAAAQRAGEWLRAWFVAPATRMNPNLEFAQVRLGHDGDRGSPPGVLDARCLAQAIDGLRLLDDSRALHTEETAAVRAWFTSYLRWLTTAKNAVAERAAKNNHGSWFLAQAIPVARFVGKDELARQLCEEDKARIAAQFRADGSQPEEIRRVDGLGYSGFNLEAQFQVARQAAALGVDLWHYTAPNGASLRGGLEFLRPFDAKPETWPTSQHEKLPPGFLRELIVQAEKNSLS